MKKILLVLTAIVFLNGCGSKNDFNAEECYNAASKNMQELNALTSKTSVKMTLAVKEDTENVEDSFEINSTIKANNLLNDDLTYQMSVSTKIFDETSQMEQWFVDGMVYTIEGNHRYALTLDDTEITSSQDKAIQGLDFGEALKYQGKKVGNKKIISIKLNDEKIKDLFKKFDIDLDANAKKLNFSDIELTINEDNYFESEKLNLDFELDGIKINADVNVTFSDYNNVMIDEFDPDSFNNIDEMLEEANQPLSEDFLNALEKIGYQNYGKGIFIKTIDNSTTYTLDLVHNYLAIGEKLFDLKLNTYFDDETSCIYDFNNNLSEGECNREALKRANYVAQEAQILMNLIEDYQ